MSARERIQSAVDTIVRDEAYDGAYGPQSEEQFNKMAARIANLVMEAIDEEVEFE